MTVRIVPVASINPSTYNPRTADPRRLDLLEVSLRKLGWLLPIFADKHGEILSGHQRHHVACRMGLLEVPVVFTEPMDLALRKAVNIAFNRGTNDMRVVDTPKTLTQALERSRVHELAARLPDLDPSSPEFMRCAHASMEPIEPLLDANRGRWLRYARNLARLLAGKGIRMPLVATPDNVVVNGIGRLEYAAAQGERSVPVVRISADEAALSDAVLNQLSMDFDLQSRYADLLRHNSFRRPRRVRDYLGRGFVFAVNHGVAANQFDFHDPRHMARWRAEHGDSVVDFGAGHLHETLMLRSKGIHVAAFEPYRLGSNDVDKAESIRCVREFLEDVATGRKYSSVFISSVLNSVPFEADRQHIVCILNALCSPTTKVYAVAQSVKSANWRMLQGGEQLAKTSSEMVLFALDYEPGIQLGDFQEKPKVQKYHTVREFYDLFKPWFEQVNVRDSFDNCEAICARPRPVDRDRLMQALAFEFDLPYPDGSRMGLVGEAIAAFAQRGVL